MKRNDKKKLQLNTKTLRTLDAAALAQVAGGGEQDSSSFCLKC